MPNFGPGVDQHINTIVTPTWVFSPTPNVVGPSVRLYNEGTQIVYVGGANVSPFNGLPLPPNSRPLEIQNMTGTVYTCSNISVTGTGYTAAAGALNAGSTAITLSGSVTTLGVGSVLVLGAAPSQEVVQIANVTATSGSVISFTLATATLYDHKTAMPMTLATSVPGQLRVTAGVL